jgi:hypothetical protein
MSAVLNQAKILGLFELDEFGSVLYSRVQYEDGRYLLGTDLTGRDFFDVVAPIQCVDELRRKINSFRSGTGIADGFRLLIRSDDDNFSVRVLLARIRDRSNSARTKSVMVHIKKT